MRFRPEHQNCGFDDRAFPRVQIIPEGKSRIIHYSGNDRLVPVVMPTPYAKDIKIPDHRNGTIEILGQKGGASCISWLKPGTRYRSASIFRTVRLEVFEHVCLRTTFTLVKDKPDGKTEPLKTKRTESEIRLIVEMANAVLRPQINIAFDIKRIQPKTSTVPLGKFVTLTAKDRNGNVEALKALGDPDAHLNVFFLWDLATSNRRADRDDVGLARADKFEVFIDDAPDSTHKAAMVLAHEMLHVFGADHVTGDESVMSESYATGGTFISSKTAKECHLRARARVGLLRG